MLQTDIADHNHLGTAGLTRNEMHSGFGNCKASGQVAQKLLVGRSIHRSCCQSDAYQVSVDTRNLSARGVYIECHTPVSIPLYRLVQFQIDRDGLATGAVPSALRGRVLSAVYRVAPASVSQRQGFALRLMVDPREAVITEQRRATA